MSVVPLPSIADLKPLTGIRILGVSVRCSGCGFEWRAELDGCMRVIPSTARCPRCAERSLATRQAD